MCNYENQCSSNLNCIKNKCSCLPNYQWKDYRNSCQLDEKTIKKLNQESCSKTEDCFVEGGLECVNKICSCTIDQYWSNQSGCSKLKLY